MKKTVSGLVLVVSVISLILAGCANLVEQASEIELVSVAARSTVMFNDEDKYLAEVEIFAVKSDHANASGPKISSNAQSDEFPGILFIWDEKQKEDAYLKVDAKLFKKYKSFTLTAKMANEYFDFYITEYPGQAMTEDGYYVYLIAKDAGNGKNINMVFISDFELIDQDVDKENDNVSSDSSDQNGSSDSKDGFENCNRQNCNCQHKHYGNGNSGNRHH